MRPSRFTALLLLPSVLSANVTLLLTAMILGISAWSYIGNVPIFYDFLYGPHGANPSLLVDTFLGLPAVYNVSVLVFAVLCGIVVFVILHATGGGVMGAAHTVRDIRGARGQAKNKLRQEAAARGILRAVCIALWVVYGVVMVRFLVPFCVLAAQHSVDYFPQLASWGYGLLSFSLLALGLHVHVVCMRLVLLRLRVVGGTIGLT